MTVLQKFRSVAKSAQSTVTQSTNGSSAIEQGDDRRRRGEFSAGENRDRGTQPEWRFDQKISEATRLSDDPRCYWQPPRRRPPSRGVLVCRRHLWFFRQLADRSPPRPEDNHPNPCLALR